MSPNRGTRRAGKAALLSAMALIGLGSMTVACSSPSEKPAETTSVTTSSVRPTEKNVNATPPPEGNRAVPCGYTTNCNHSPD